MNGFRKLLPFVCLAALFISCTGKQPAPETAAFKPQKVGALPEPAVLSSASGESVAAAAGSPSGSEPAVSSVPAPKLGKASGAYPGTIQVSIAISLPEASVFWTLDGSEPTSAHGTRYSGPVAVLAPSILRVRAFAPGGQSSPEVSADYSIGELCVAPGSSGRGTRSSPLGDISAALSRAKAEGFRTVKLAEGSYQGPLVVDFPVSLSGGWRTGFASFSAQYSVIQGAARPSTTKKAPGYAVRFQGAALDGKVRIERLSFRGSSENTSYSAGLVVSDGASPAFSHCEAVGGFGSYGYGAVVLASSPAFTSCRFDGGDGATGFGLSVDSGSARIVSSTATAGSGTVAGYGLAVTDAKVVAENSVFAGNKANTSYGAAFYNSSASTLSSCTIVGGSGREVSAVFASVSRPSLVSCILSAEGTSRSYGYTANYGDSLPSALSRTVFLGCSGGLVYSTEAKKACMSLSPEGAVLSPDGTPPLSGAGNTGNSRSQVSLGQRFSSPGLEAGAKL